MQCRELWFISNYGSLGVTCSPRRVAKHVASLWSWILQYDFRILDTNSYNVLEAQECESEFGSLEFHLIINCVEANAILNTLKFSISLLFQDNLEESFLKADGGEISLI